MAFLPGTLLFLMIPVTCAGLASRCDRTYAITNPSRAASFDVGGLVPFAYAFFALALGVAAGAIVRHTVGAMFVAVRLAVAQLRPHFLPPLGAQKAGAASWTSLLVQKTPPLLLYQPVERFWMFQGIEAAIFVALALTLLVLTLWWMRQRIA